jgi:hypothetical protein
MGRNERIRVKSTPKLFDVVELLSDRPGAGPVAGSLGTVVEELPGKFYLVEFCDDNGKTLSVETLAAEDVTVRG